MELTIESLKFKNFKGGNEDIQFSHCTNIYGDNRIGKTRIFDAITWVLFGKDSHGKSDFDIMPLDSNNKMVAKVEVEVEIVIMVDGKDVVLMKVLKQKWVKRRGSKNETFTGFETTYHAECMNIKKSQYEKYIGDIIDIQRFKLLTDPLAFHALKWEDRRKLLFSMSDIMSDNDIAEGFSDFIKNLVSSSFVSVEDKKKEITSSINKMKKELDLIPGRIDEVKNMTPDGNDFEEIKKMLQVKESAYNDITTSIVDHNAQYKKLEEKKEALRGKINAYELKRESIRSKLYDKHTHGYNSGINIISEGRNQLNMLNVDLNSKLELININIETISAHQSDMDKLRAKWTAINGKEFNFDEAKGTCPTCEQKLPDSKVIELKETGLGDFNKNKSELLEGVNKQGLKLKDAVVFLEQKNVTLRNEVAELEKDRDTINNLIEDTKKNLKEPDASLESYIRSDSEYRECDSLIKKLNHGLLLIKIDSNDSLNSQRDAIVVEINELKNKLSVETEIEKHTIRVQELELLTSEIVRNIDTLESQLYEIEQFTKKKIELVEDSINSKFKFIKLRMYELQLNGGEKETCVTTINGVSYNSANTESKVNAGIDIINALSLHFDQLVPVVVDNRESVSELLPVRSQVINLIVEKGTKNLRIDKY